MGVEHPTGSDDKGETTDQPKGSDQARSLPHDQPGSPGKKSRLESRAAAQQPYEPGEDEKRETPPPVRSARAERSNDPNDDPNRIGTPRSDSLATARGEAPETKEDNGGVAETGRRDSSTEQPRDTGALADDDREPEAPQPSPSPETAINETLHSRVRSEEKGIDPEEVIENAHEVYYDENGNQIYVWEQDDKRSQVTIRDPSNGNIVTNQWSTNEWIQRQLDKDRWYRLDD